MSQQQTKSLLMLHGNGGGGFRFSLCRDYFLKNLVISTPTLPGFYPAARDPDFTTLAHYAQDLAQHLEELPRPRTLLGTGIGGSIALELLQREPNIVDKLILHAPVGAQLDSRLFPKIINLPGVASLARNLVGNPLLSPFWARLFFEGNTPKDFLSEFFRGYLHCGVFGQMFALINHEWWCGLKPVEVPTVLLWGARERLLSVDQLDSFLEKTPNADIQIVEHWRHFPMIDQADEFAKIVESLI